jgi:dihydrofolate synthase/folylpolyglutamate synthase
MVTVITSISLDHTRQLGNTLAEIAMEKAGIIKPGVPLLCGRLESEPRQVIAKVARQQGCRQIAAGENFRHTYRHPKSLFHGDLHGRLDFVDDFSSESLRLNNVPLRLLGEHQADNGALALATACELCQQGWSISVEAMRQGLAEVALPARIEVLGSQPTVVLDVAHNVASVQALVQTLERVNARERDSQREWILLLAVSHDKDVSGMIRELVPHFSVIIATQYHENPRAVPALELATLIEEQLDDRAVHSPRISNPLTGNPMTGNSCEVLVEPQPVDAWRLARKRAQPDQLICITGSFFIAAELRAVLLQANSSARSVSV